MKIPLLPIHIVTSKRLKEIFNNAFEEGKKFKKRQLEMLLYHRSMTAIRTIAANKQKSKELKGGE